MLLSPADCVPECVEKLADGPLCFYDLRHQTLYAALAEMRERSVPVDLMTVKQWLKDRQQLEAVGGVAYFSSLPECVPSAANLPYYLSIVAEKWTLRRLLRSCTEAAARIQEDEGEVAELVDAVERDVLAAARSGAKIGARSLKELVPEAVDHMEAMHRNAGKTTGVPTGLSDLDRLTGGLQPGDMVVVAARPSVGKTSLAMNIADHAAVECKLPVAVFSLEMTAKALAVRLVCARARVNLKDVRDGLLSEHDFPKLAAAAGKLANAPLYVDDSSGLSVGQLKAKARRLWQQHGVKLFVVDYLQLLHATGRKAENRQQEITQISGGLKELAKETGVPVLVLSQLNRELEKRGPGERPRLSDIRESGSVEQDADLVGLLYNNEDDGEQEQRDRAAVPVRIFVAKQRNGPTGDVDMVFLKQITRFESAAKVADQDYQGGQ
jgi:replicative DNA helicase